MSAKKKNLVPLFGVAFIVAIISTGIFYGLFVGKLNSATSVAAATEGVWIAAKAIPAGTVLSAEHLKTMPWIAPPLPAGAVTKLADAVGQTVIEPLAEHELLTVGRLASKAGGPVAGGSMGIPNGMRAVSLTVQDSGGVVAMLKPGHRVDVQVVGPAPGAPYNQPQLRTMVENMQILTIPREPQYSRPGAQVVTVLATPNEASVLGLADSTAKIRIALRNPLDQKKENPNSPIPAPRQNSTPASSAPVATNRAAPPKTNQQVQFLVRVAGGGAEAIHELESHLDSPARGGEMLQVAAFRTGASLDKALESMQQSKRMEVFATSQVQASQRQEAGAQWSLDSKTQEYRLRIQLEPSLQPNGKVRLRVHPEVSKSGEKGVNRRKVDTEIELADGQSFLVRGFADPGEESQLWQQLFPGMGSEATRQEMVVVVTPKVVRQPLSTERPAT